MDAIRQFIDVKNNSFSVVLPENFKASRVEVIILPSGIENDIPQWQKEIVNSRLADYLQNPNNVEDFDEFLDELEREL
jgi:hypothetical protein